MGTKGRDATFWLFALSLTGAALLQSRIMYGMAMFFALILGFYYLVYVPAAARASRRMGLRIVVLLPVWYPWLYFNPRRIKGRWTKAWEIHVTGAEPEKFLPQLEADLLFIKSAMRGLFIWETSAPVPASIRKLVRDLEKEGKSFWVKGTWSLPSAPFTKRELVRGYVRRGAILLEKGE